jgi:chromosome segregation ATPase
LKQKLRDLEIEHEKLRVEHERVQKVRGAYNADKKVLVDRISELEQALREAKEEREQLERRFSLLEQSAGTYRNEINYLQGKNATLKRDLEH